MLSIWLHRLAFAPALLAVLVAAFAFTERPRPVGTTLAPDAFSGVGARLVLSELDAAGDGALAVAQRRLRAAGFRPRMTTGEDGQTVVAERVGRDDRRLLVVAPLPAGARRRARRRRRRRARGAPCGPRRRRTRPAPASSRSAAGAP